jgi:hypothetical protein
MPDFNEFSLEMFDMCLKLLVKIEEDKTELIMTFIDRYKYLISRKFDEIFGMKESVTEIDYNTYMKIYDNFEFAINENEFLFYEQQITEINNNPNNEKSIKNLTSKLFKKGTFIWICKKVNENIISFFINLAYKYFIGLFDKQNSDKMNVVYSYVAEVFYKKVKDLLERSSEVENFDPVFFKEGLTSFYYPMREVLHRIGDENINAISLSEKILQNNQLLTEIYINIHSKGFIVKQAEIIKSGLTGVSSHYEKRKLIAEGNIILNNLNNNLFESLMFLKKMDLSLLYNETTDETTTLYYHKILALINQYYFVFKSVNMNRFSGLTLKNSTITADELAAVRNSVDKVFSGTLLLDRIYLKVILFKLQNASVKQFVDKIFKEFPPIKNNRQFATELRSLLDKELAETASNLYDSLILVKDKEYFGLTRDLFFNIDWIGYDTAIGFRKDIRGLCYNLYNFKVELYDLLEEEKKQYNEVKSGINELMMNKTKKKLTKFQKEMECLHIRRMSIYSNENDSPQAIMLILTKILLKNINEFIKLTKFNTQGFQQVQIDMNLIKYFLRENIISDTENILDGFFLEIMKNCSFNCTFTKTFDDTVSIKFLHISS